MLETNLTFRGIYKKNIFSKPIEINLTLSNTDITVQGLLSVYINGFRKIFFDTKVIKYKDIVSNEIQHDNKNNWLYISWKSDNRLNNVKLFNIKSIELSKEKLDEKLTMIRKEAEEKSIKEAKNKEEYKQQQLKIKYEKYNYYKNEIEKYINNDDIPCYKFACNDFYASFLFLDKDKNINFMIINGYDDKIDHKIIFYDNINYYDKIGDVYYTNDLNVDYKGGDFYAGGFSPDRINYSPNSQFFNMLDFDTIALMQVYDPPRLTGDKLNITSTPNKIDERSITLNYYDTDLKQYSDLPLPQDIYNFLQTHLPEKKYSIVEELNKQKNIQSNKAFNINGRLTELKELYEEQLISYEEYCNRKQEILSEI